MTSVFSVPNCFTWNTKKSCTKKPIQPVSKVSERVFKYIYDKDKEDTLNLFVVCHMIDNVFHLGAKRNTTVKELKEHIKRLKNIPISLLLLFFKGVLLNNTQILEESGVTNRSKLLLKLKLHTAICEECVLPKDHNRWIKVTLVSITGKAFEVKVPTANTIDSLKEVVERSFDVHRNEVLLLYRSINLEDDMTFEEYGITSDKNILLIFYQHDNCGFCGGCAKAAERPTLTLHYFHNVFVCLFQPQVTVRKFKKTSYRYLHHVHPDLQRILYKEEELDDAKTLHDYEISNGDDLFVELKFDSRLCDHCKGLLS
ncbi:hypothetical protein RN001_010292 [Aquatica leii]|uniref:Ubiquitin-like domain-containing protein n=1 Tax=Aquatica leii TaxID=1421715 RepID=A0AAN7S8I3_9COLE|nr:hypothetical protein RN001_010292 [Aquatica leii]